MTALTFDTHLFVKRLRDKGAPEAQAEAIIDVMRDARAQSLQESATKADLRELELRMDSRFKDLQVRLGSMIVVLGGLLIAVKYLG